MVEKALIIIFVLLTCIQYHSIYPDYPQAQITLYQMFNLKSEQLFTCAQLWRLKSVVKQITFKREEARQLNYHNGLSVLSNPQ